MSRTQTIEETIAREAVILCSNKGSDHSFDAIVHLRSKNDGQGFIIGYDSENGGEDLLGYYIGEESEEGIPIFRVRPTTLGSSKEQIGTATSHLVAYLKCIQMGRDSLKRVRDELVTYTLGEVTAEERLG